jgi:predicted nucleic acid-binding protein
MPASQDHVVVTDANVLINFIHLDRLTLLNRIPRHRFSVPEQVVDEITRPDQASALSASLTGDQLDRCDTSDRATFELFSRLCLRIDVGEAACIAIAFTAGHLVATDERRQAERIARQLLGEFRLLRTEDVIDRCIRAGLISISEADGFKSQLEARRYKMNFASFAERMAA